MNKKYYMKTSLSTITVLLLSLTFFIYNIFDIINPDTEAVELVVSILMVVVFGIFSISIILLLVQTKRNVAYIEITNDTIIQQNLLGKKIEVQVISKLEYKKNRRKELVSINIHDEDKKTQIIITDNYDTELSKIGKRVELFRTSAK